MIVDDEESLQVNPKSGSLNGPSRCANSDPALTTNAKRTAIMADVSIQTESAQANLPDAFQLAHDAQNEFWDIQN